MKSFEADFYSNKKLLVIPQEPDAFAKLQSIDRKTRYDCGAKYGIVSGSDWQMNTIANECLENLIQFLALGMQTSATTAINFYDLFFVKATNRISEKADKEGNINIVFQPGPRAIELISLPEPLKIETQVKAKDEFMFPDPEGADRDIQETFRRIDQAARYQLAKKYRLMMLDDMDYAAIAVLDQFVLNLFTYMLYELGQDPKLTMSSINFNDNVEFHALREGDDKIMLTMRPGMNAKLLIKADNATEEIGGDD